MKKSEVLKKIDQHAMRYCPRDLSMLNYEECEGNMGLACYFCPYFYKIPKGRPITYSIFPTKKSVDDVLGGADAWKNVDQTDAACTKPLCEGRRAFFMQVQTRSADEPMTTYYRCCKCANVWSENQ